MIVKFTSIQTVISKVVNDLGLDYEEIPWEMMVDWIAHALQHIGSYTQFESVSCKLEVEDNRAILPQDFYRVDSDKFMMRHKITMNTISVEQCDGCIDLHYLKMPVDEEGYPMIPDDPTYIDALFWNITSKLAMRGELKNKDLTYQYCNAQWLFYCGSARAEGYMPDLQQMQSRANDFRKMHYDTNPLRNKFRDLGVQQELRRNAK